jgi:tRNA pseudouridine55 synthase
MTTTSGLLLVDKPGGVTSHDVVARVRRILHERRVGHAGTLDPMATGLLVLGVGPATRLLRFAQSEEKTYVGTVHFGVATDSLDADGVVVGEAAVPELDDVEVNERAASFLGPQTQVPPMVSALKVKGQRLHELARQGVEVERAARPITVHAFSLTPTESRDEWDFEVRCSVGTYVRVLLSDLAESLGTLGHLTALRRTRSGHFRVEDARRLDDLEDAIASGASPLSPPGAFVAHLERCSVDAEDVTRLRQGRRLVLASSFATTEIAAFDLAGALVAVLVRRGEEWQPELVLPAEGANEPG